MSNRSYSDEIVQAFAEGKLAEYDIAPMIADARAKGVELTPGLGHFEIEGGCGCAVACIKAASDCDIDEDFDWESLSNGFEESGRDPEGDCFSYGDSDWYRFGARIRTHVDEAEAAERLAEIEQSREDDGCYEPDEEDTGYDYAQWRN